MGEEGVGFMRSTLEMIPSVHEFGAEVSGSVLSDDEAPPANHLFDPGFFVVEPVPVGLTIAHTKHPALAFPALFSPGADRGLLRVPFRRTPYPALAIPALFSPRGGLNRATLRVISYQDRPLPLHSWHGGGLYRAVVIRKIDSCIRQSLTPPRPPWTT
jgi:hypothetical protein